MTYQLQDLLYLMARLRDPEHGCPWDQQQSLRSIVPHTLEEAYEVADVIEREDLEHLPSELGDLLFQVVYYSQIAQEENRFSFTDVINAVMEKMIRRHPHVFPGGDLYATATHTTEHLPIGQQWETIKAQEQPNSQHSPLASVPLNLPGLTRALKLQQKASRLGFDWTYLAPVIDKLDEEVQELKEAITKTDTDAITHELGDVFFSLTNIARHLGIDPEQALRDANHRFSQRFTYVAQQVSELGGTIKDTSPEQLDLFWEEAKQQQSLISSKNS